MALNALIIFAHPLFEKSKVHKALLKYVKRITGVTIRDLYQEYPDFYIHIDDEKSLLEKHDIIILQHPIYWYSCPPLLKQWIDQVLEVGWAYGKGGDALAGKALMQVVSTGGPEQAYQPDGINRYTLRTFLSPFEQMSKLCGMKYLAPYVVHGAHRLADVELENHGSDYFYLVEKMTHMPGIVSDLEKMRYANDWFQNIIR